MPSRPLYGLTLALPRPLSPGRGVFPVHLLIISPPVQPIQRLDSRKKRQPFSPPRSATVLKASRSNVLHATGSGSSPGLLAGHVAATGLRHSRAPAGGIRPAVRNFQPSRRIMFRSPHGLGASHTAPGAPVCDRLCVCELRLAWIFSCVSGGVGLTMR